jgi:gas vesicle protein
MNTGKVALGILAAAATGALLGVLFAPSSGAALRRKTKRMGERELNKMKDRYDEFAENMTQNYEKVRDNIIDYTHKVKSGHNGKMEAATKN